jgi:hypothetical protein
MIGQGLPLPKQAFSPGLDETVQLHRRWISLA